MSVIQNKSENEKKKNWFFLLFYNFEAYKFSLPEKLWNKFLRQWKSQLVSENWKGYEKSKVCEAPVGKDLQIFLTGWCREL